jgi:F0F1-type ATP synthase assembly protein I
MAPAILGLLQFAPKLINLFGDRGSKITEVAETIGSIAQQITGGKSVSESVAALQADPQLAYQFEVAVMANETVLERLDEQSRARASEQYKVTHKTADQIANIIMKTNLPVVGVLVMVNVVAVDYFADQGPLVAVVSNLIGVVIGHLLSERQAVTAFFFGSSLGSKLKDGVTK